MKQIARNVCKERGSEVNPIIYWFLFGIFLHIFVFWWVENRNELIHINEGHTRIKYFKRKFICKTSLKLILDKNENVGGSFLMPLII